MGSFDSTCAVTRTAITGGDEVLLVMIRRTEGGVADTWVKDTYNLMSWLGSIARTSKEHLEDPEKSQEVNTFRKEIYDMATEPLKRIFVSFGTYDDYGWINEVDKDDSYNNDYLFFIHKDVVDRIVELHSMKEYNFLGIYSKVIAVAHFAFLARIQLFGNDLLGQQYGLYEKSEADAIRLANIFQREKLKRYKEVQRESIVEDIKDWLWWQKSRLLALLKKK